MMALVGLWIFRFLPTLHAMLSHTRSRKRTIAMLAAMLLVLCQVSFLAQACASISSAGNTEATPCHSSDEPRGDSPTGDHARPGCEAPAIAAEPVSVAFAAVSIFSAMPATLQVLPASTGPSWLALRGHAAHCRPPPLTILHCRFLN